MITLLSIIYGIASVFLIIIVLIQSGKGAGMGLFGGGGSNTTFGAQGGNILTRITTVLGIIFFGLAIIFAIDKTSGPISDKFKKEQQKIIMKNKIFQPRQDDKQKKAPAATNTAPTNR